MTGGNICPIPHLPHRIDLDQFKPIFFKASFLGDKNDSRTNKHAISFYRPMLIGSGQTLND